MKFELSSLMLIHMKKGGRPIYMLLRVTSRSSQSTRCLSFSRLLNSLLVLTIAEPRSCSDRTRMFVMSSDDSFLPKHPNKKHYD